MTRCLVLSQSSVESTVVVVPDILLGADHKVLHVNLDLSMCWGYHRASVTTFPVSMKWNGNGLLFLSQYQAKGGFRCVSSLVPPRHLGH